jgi:conjugal transfer pilus assembly protein TraF
MLVLMSLFITGVHANEDQTLIKDTPFVSGQAFKKGFSGMTTQPGKLRKKLMRLRLLLHLRPSQYKKKRLILIQSG